MYLREWCPLGIVELADQCYSAAGLPGYIVVWAPVWSRVRTQLSTACTYVSPANPILQKSDLRTISTSLLKALPWLLKGLPS
jgi:hypothetical protein